jgi:hypothetical protein
MTRINASGTFRRRRAAFHSAGECRRGGDSPVRGQCAPVHPAPATLPGRVLQGIVTLHRSSPRCEPKQSWEAGRAASIPPAEGGSTSIPGDLAPAKTSIRSHQDLAAREIRPRIFAEHFEKPAIIGNYANAPPPRAPPLTHKMLNRRPTAIRPSGVASVECAHRRLQVGGTRSPCQKTLTKSHGAASGRCYLRQT